MALRDFRPSVQGLDYFESDLFDKMYEMGHPADCEMIVNSIDYYDWDNDARWFVMVHIYGLKADGSFGKTGYVEFDVYVNCLNDEEVSIEKVELPGHGYPCSGITIATQDLNTGWIVTE